MQRTSKSGITMSHTSDGGLGESQRGYLARAVVVGVKKTYDVTPKSIMVTVTPATMVNHPQVL